MQLLTEEMCSCAERPESQGEASRDGECAQADCLHPVKYSHGVGPASVCADEDSYPVRPELTSPPCTTSMHLVY